METYVKPSMTTHGKISGVIPLAALAAISAAEAAALASAVGVGVGLAASKSSSGSHSLVQFRRGMALQVCAD